MKKSTGHFKFIPIVLSTDAKFFVIPRKFLMLTKNLSYKFAYGHLSCMTVSNLLWMFPQVNNRIQNEGGKGKSLW